MRHAAKHRIALIAGLVLSLVVVLPLDAQRGPPAQRRQGQDRAQLEQRIRAQMGEMMRTQLGLSEEEGVRLSEAVQEFESQRRSLGREAQALRRRVEALTLEGSDDQQEAMELLDRTAALRVHEAELFVAEQARLREILSPVQVLRYHALREQLGERIQRFREGQRGRGNGDGGRGGALVDP